MWDVNDENEYNEERKDKFIDDIFEIAFGETTLKAELLENCAYQEVTNKIMEYSDNAFKWEEQEDMLEAFIKTLNMEEEEDYLLYERLEQFKKEQK